MTSRFGQPVNAVRYLSTSSPEREKIKKQNQGGRNMIIVGNNSRQINSSHPVHQQPAISSLQKATTRFENDRYLNAYSKRTPLELRKIVLAQDTPLICAYGHIGLISDFINTSSTHKRQESTENNSCESEKVENELLSVGKIKSGMGQIKFVSALIASDLVTHSVRTGLPLALAKRRLLRRRRYARLKSQQRANRPVKSQHMFRICQRRQKRKKNQTITSSCLTGRVRGLPNHGQTCFLNSVLQALASLTPFVAYLERINELQQEVNERIFEELEESSDEVLRAEDLYLSDLDHCDESQRIPRPFFSLGVRKNGKNSNRKQRQRQRQRQGTRLTPLLLSALRHANDSSASNNSPQVSSLILHKVDPTKILNLVARKHNQFKSRTEACFASMNEQQDAQELLQALISVVISESNLDHGSDGDAVDDIIVTANPCGSYISDDMKENKIICDKNRPKSRVGGRYLLEHYNDKRQNRSLGDDDVSSSYLFDPSLTFFSEDDVRMLENQNHHYTSLKMGTMPASSFRSTDIITKETDESSKKVDCCHYFSHCDDDNSCTKDTAVKNRSTVALSQSVTYSDGFCIDVGEEVGGWDANSISTISSSGTQKDEADATSKLKRGNDDVIIDSFHPYQKYNGERIITLSSMLTKVGKEQKRHMRDRCNISIKNVKLDCNEAVAEFCKRKKNERDDKDYQTSYEEEGTQVVDDNIIAAPLEARATIKVACSQSKRDLSSFSTSFSSSKSEQKQIPTSMQIMIKTLSSITPTPLNGWFGSTLKCCQCGHISPIQNAPFLEIPIVPTSLSCFQKRVASFRDSSTSSSSPPLSISACSLEDCLSDFTTVERVHEVDCRSCAIKMELEYLENEVSILKGAIENIVSRRGKDEKLSKQLHTDFKNDKDGDVVDKGGNDINESPATQVLCQSLRRMESRKQFLEGLDPDDTAFLDNKQFNDNYYYNKENNSEHRDYVYDDGFLHREYCYSDFNTLVPEEEKKCGDEGRKDNNASASFSIVPKPHRGDANKRLLLTRLPPILCIHVKRLFYNPRTNLMAKTLQHINFPELLDLSHYCAYGGGGCGIGETLELDGRRAVCLDESMLGSATTDRKPILYRLMSLIEHRGNAYNGHYLTFRRVVDQYNTEQSSSPRDYGKRDSDKVSRLSKEWAMVSDEKVSFVDWSEVSQRQAYMLYYEAV